MRYGMCGVRSGYVSAGMARVQSTVLSERHWVHVRAMCAGIFPVISLDQPATEDGEASLVTGLSARP